MTSKERIYSDLCKLGLKNGDTVIVHSSLSSMGHVEGGAETVIQAIREVIGENGTLLFPAFTYATVNESVPFVESESEACVGKIPETFRKLPGVVRSIHPTHSVAAIGRYAEEMTRDHKLDNTPLGKNSPYTKLYEYGAKILMLGCSLASTSYMHALEEEAGVPYVLTKTPVIYKIAERDGSTYEKEYYKHNFKRAEAPVLQKYKRCLDVLTEGEGYVSGEVHGAQSYLIDARTLHDAAIDKLKNDPYYFVGVKDMNTYKTDLELSDSQGYDVIILAGQSNAVGFGAGDSDIVFTETDDMLEITDTYPIAYFTNEEGKRLLDMPFPPELYFGRLRDRFAYGRWNACLANLFGQCYVNGGHLEKGRKLLVVKAAVGGSGFTKEQWTEGGDCSNKMFHMVKEALKLSNDMRIVAFLWHQGEADAFDLPERSPEVRHAKYVENFGNFVDRVRKAYGHGFPIICGEFTRTWIAKNQIACNAVLTAMQKVVDRDGFAEIVSSEGLIPNGVKIGTTDILHFSRDALHRFGIRYYESFVKLTEKKK